MKERLMNAKKESSTPSNSRSIETSKEKEPQFFQMTSNLININLNQLLKETPDLSTIEKNLRDFYEKFGEINENVSVMKFLENFFELLDSFQQKNSQNISNIFLLLKKIIEMPFSRIIEQFAKLRTLYLEKITKIKENSLLKDENKNLEEKCRLLMREVEKLKLFLRKNDLLEPRNLEEILLENEKLKQILQKQRKTLCNHRRKDEKMMKLLNAIRKNGVNIEEIYRENVKSEDNSFMDEPSFYEETEKRAQPYEAEIFSLTKEKNCLIFNENSDKKKELKMNFSFTTPVENKEFFEKKHDLKGKLKLNLEIMNNPVGDLEKEGFYEEFMSKFDEFSESWRVLAMKEKRF